MALSAVSGSSMDAVGCVRSSGLFGWVWVGGPLGSLILLRGLLRCEGECVCPSFGSVLAQHACGFSARAIGLVWPSCVVFTFRVLPRG